jgi:hypothetical protein
MRPTRITLPTALAAALGILFSCSSNPAGAEFPTVELADAELRVLFVGNSLTYFNELPEMVQTIAEAVGHSLAVAEVAFPDFSLEDHWNTGVESAIQSAAADVVVLQQGPSSLPDNQTYLRVWTDTLSRAIRDAGGRPALFMVWPSRARLDFMPDVRESYSRAAEAVNGIFIPAGQSWMSAWEKDETLALYNVDQFHPSTLGSAVAALTIFSVLFDEPVAPLPAALRPTTSGLPVIELGEDAPAVYAAVDKTVAEWARR